MILFKSVSDYLELFVGDIFIFDNSTLIFFLFWRPRLQIYTMSVNIPFNLYKIYQTGVVPTPSYSLEGKNISVLCVLPEQQQQYHDRSEERRVGKECR